MLTLKSRVAALRTIGSRPAVALVQMLDFFERFDVEKYGSDGGPLHDPTVIAYLLKPELFSGRDCNVEVETASPLTAGMTVAMHPQTYKTWVFFGTGMLMLSSDMTNHAVQSMYGFVDDGSVIARLGGGANLTARKVMEAGSVNGFPVRTFEANTPLPPTSKGWYIDLLKPPVPPGTAEGERVVSEGQVVGDILVFASVIPTASDCNADGTGYINALNAFTGASAGPSYFDLDGDGQFNDEVLSGLPVGSVNLGSNVGMPTLPNLLRGLLVAGGSGGGMGSVATRESRNVGRVSWREVVRD